MDNRAAGIDNDNFRKATDMLIRAHAAFAT
jgi:hypothetical protein